MQKGHLRSGQLCYPMGGGGSGVGGALKKDSSIQTNVGGRGRVGE